MTARKGPNSGQENDIGHGAASLYTDVDDPGTGTTESDTWIAPS